MSEVAVSTADATSASTGGRPAVPDVVEVTLPPDGAYLSVLRTATAGLAARLDFTLDDIEDLRIAVDEACAMLLPHAVDGASLTCRFQLRSDRLDVTVTLPTQAAAVPERDTFAWTVLTALAGEVDAGLDDNGAAWIALHKRRGVVGSA